MQTRYIPAIVTLSAGAVVSITCIANKMDKLLSLEILLGVLIVFYILGIIAKAIISNVLNSVNAEEENSEGENDENAEQSEDAEMSMAESEGEPKDSLQG